MSNIRIRKAELNDAEAILKVYEYYVLKTAISFEYDVPTVEEFRSRMERTLKKYPYIVAEMDNEIVGYAYTSPFVGREAYDWSVETTIYLKQNVKRKGLGKKLYQVIENISRAQNINNLYACIGYPEIEDEYLTKNSVQFHDHVGFHWIGEFKNCGYKFDRWYHMVWMGKAISECKPHPDPLIPFPQFTSEELVKLGLN
ncbi:Sortase and related acyltransferase [Neocallimastix lanati (nom. inval.)]|uniref:Sortase and related acyltransferase n=1 Tax=Neocallimastix californiae TaxID=1754190 RepID=A0A1Y2AA74_9FUNG|nr:Sortase and related acyltransferase [Neocallimastix sp. JGI-2020a]ORY19364.1 Sortase and related acyltransferase [Neocallimastix californiae]|eukprot:ORY19364.1 Sortase and related acyltransferase [Neocallimastix californiae]